MKIRYLFLLTLLLLTGCARNDLMRDLHGILDAPYFTHKHLHGPLTIGVRELHMSEIRKIFWAPEELDDNYRVVHLRVRNSGNGVHMLYPRGVRLASHKEIAKHIDPSNSKRSQWISTGMSVASLGTSYAIIKTNPSIDPFPVLLFTGLGFAVIGSLIQSAFFDTKKFKPLDNYLLLRERDSNPLVTVKPYEQHDLLMVVPRMEKSSEIAFSLSTTNQSDSTDFALKVAAAL